MSQWMLDTNICIYIIKKKPAPLLKYLQKTSISECCISSITLAELEYGIEKSSNPMQNRIALFQFVAPLEILPFDDVAASIYGKLRTGLELKGKVIGAMDLLIAAHAVSADLTLVTNNEKEFRRIPELKVENWV